MTSHWLPESRAHTHPAIQKSESGINEYTDPHPHSAHAHSSCRLVSDLVITITVGTAKTIIIHTTVTGKGKRPRNHVPIIGAVLNRSDHHSGGVGPAGAGALRRVKKTCPCGCCECAGIAVHEKWRLPMPVIHVLSSPCTQQRPARHESHRQRRQGHAAPCCLGYRTDITINFQKWNICFRV